MLSRKHFAAERKNDALLEDASRDPVGESNVRAKRESFKITSVYLIAGCFWILFTDILEGRVFAADSGMVTISVLKGLLYVFITSLLIYGLTYPSIKKVLVSKSEIKKMNEDLEKSNQQYKSLYQELDKKQALLKALINSIPDLIFYKSTNCVYLGCNKAFEEFIGKTEEEIIGQTDIELFGPEGAKKFQSTDIETMKASAPKRVEETVTYANGRSVSLETLKSPYYDMNGSSIGLIGVSRDISERKRREKKIQYLIYHDVLTGVYNRTFFQEERKRLDHADFLPLSIIIGDVNGMKLINDAFGHMEGDMLLVEIADILKQCSRQDDIVARIGGDEFCILLPKTDLQVAQSITDQIRIACEDKRSDRHMLRADIALGYAVKENTEDSFDETIILAEDLMYRRKLLERKSLHSSILTSIKTTMFEKSNETEAHAERIAELSIKLGKAVGLPVGKMDELELVATLHDIGKISIDQNILTKVGKLTKEEWHAIKKHPEVGYRIANSCPELRHIADYILCHHERWDGDGYPQGLSGENIPLISRIISVTDSYDAMTQDRAYKKAISQEQALEELVSNAGTQFDPDLVKAFIEIIKNGSL